MQHNKALLLVFLLFSLLLSLVAGGVIKLTDDNADDQLSHGDWLLLLYVNFFFYLFFTSKKHTHNILNKTRIKYYKNMKVTFIHSYDGSKHKAEEGEWKALGSHAKEVNTNFLVGKADCAKYISFSFLSFPLPFLLSLFFLQFPSLHFT
jgi:hypothetical protein